MSEESSLQVTSDTPENVAKLSDFDRREQSAREFRAQLEQIQREAEEGVNAQSQENAVEKEESTHEPDVNLHNQDNESEDVNRNDSDEDEFAHGPIPKKRFNKEIEKRKILESELQRERELRIKYQTEQELYNKALDQLKQKQDQEPLDNLDPIDENAHRYYEKRIKELESKIEKQSSTLTAEQYQRHFENTVNYQQAEFEKSHPDFHSAYQHALQAEYNSLKLLGMDDAQAAQATQTKFATIAQVALKAEKNVPEIIYNIAKNYGYSVNLEKAPKSTAPTPNLEKIDRNIRKSDTILNDIPEASTKLAQPATSILSLESFSERLTNANGHGVNANEFRKALERLKSGT